MMITGTFEVHFLFVEQKKFPIFEVAIHGRSWSRSQNKGKSGAGAGAGVEIK